MGGGVGQIRRTGLVGGSHRKKKTRDLKSTEVGMTAFWNRAENEHAKAGG